MSRNDIQSASLVPLLTEMASVLAVMVAVVAACWALSGNTMSSSWAFLLAFLVIVLVSPKAVGR